MRRPLILLALVVLAMPAAACAGTAGPAWTYAPPTEAPSAAPAASGAASAAPSGAPASAAPSEGASGGTGGTIVQISASNIAFEQTEVSAPAGTAFTIHFNNKDAGTPHNVAIKDASGMAMFKGDIVLWPMAPDSQ